MRIFRKNTFGYAHHAVLGLVVIAVIVFAGIKVLTGIHAATPASADIGDAASITPSDATSIVPSSDQAQALEASTTKCTDPIQDLGKNYPPKSKPSSEVELTTLNKQVAAAINAFRAAQKIKDPSTGKPVPDLTTTGYSAAELHKSAYTHTIEEGMYGYFAHSTPKNTPGHLNGWCWSSRLAHYYPKGSYKFYTIGENAVFASPSSDMTAAYAMNLWRHSPPHLRNLKDPNWRNLGVSAVEITGGPWQCSDCYDTTTIITTDFGARH